ncbi:MAG: response regulator transcription factor [Chloroflexi bacterium]|nr:response regulator transcription factor [Chloroflexota bacterium]
MLLPSSGDDLRILVVADDPLARAGLAAMLGGQPGCTIVGQSTGQPSLVTELDVYRPDVIVWDAGWDPASAVENLVGLEGTEPLVLVLLPDEAHVSEILAAGARGLLRRDTDASMLLAALNAVAQGLLVLAPEFGIAEPLIRGPLPTPLPEALTLRELEVLRLLAEGLPNKSISRRLGISEHTVKFHVNAILGKLGAQSRTEAVILATRLGLILL